MKTVAFCCVGGIIDLMKIITKGKLKMVWEYVNNISVVISLILFVTFIIGRIWVVLQTKNEIDESLDTELNENFIIVDEFNVGGNNEERIYLTATHTLLNVKIYKCDFSEKSGKLSKGELYIDCGKLRNGFTFQFNTYLVEGIPSYLLEYQSNNDYTKGQLLFSENGKNGIIAENIYKKHTVKSVFYQFFK